MNLGRTFTTQETPSNALRLIGETLERAGYKPATPPPTTVYQRGSKMGSMFGFTNKVLQATATLQARPEGDGSTSVSIAYAIETSMQILTRKDRLFWDNELDSLVAAAGGVNADSTPLAKAEENLRQTARIKGGANWFYLIAFMSLLNSLMWVFQLGYYFFIGLGITQLVDGIATGIAQAVSPDYTTLLRIGALLIDVLIAGLFALFGYLANRGRHWAFIVGAVLYGLDALIFLMVPDIISILFHIVGLVFILAGYRTARKAAAGVEGA